MVVNWISPDAQKAFSNFTCAGCLLRVNKGDDIYLAKQGERTVKLCEECAASVEVDREVTQADRENWLGEV